MRFENKDRSSRMSYFIFNISYVFSFCLILTAQFSLPVLAQYSSPNFRVEEAFFGTGGELDPSSNSFKAQQSLGSLAAGATSSSNYDAVAGFVTANQPFLEMTVSDATVDLGLLSDASSSSGAATGGPCVCSFTVRTYLSSAYVVLTMSQPPTSEGGAVLDAKTTQGVPSTNPNVEEFGMNLVDNTSPDMGNNPLNSPDNTFADGTAATGYNVIDQFKYGVGDTIARSAATAGNQAVGQTNYTISYIAKRKPLTEAGLYTMNHDLVAVVTF